MADPVGYEVRVAQPGDDVQLDAFLRGVGFGGLADSLYVDDHWIYQVYVALSATHAVAGVLEGQIVYGSRYRPEQACRVFHLLVSPALRRTGVGTALMTRFAQDALAAERTSIVVGVDPRGPVEPRVAFFESCGLSWTDREQGFMGGDIQGLLQAVAGRRAQA